MIPVTHNNDINERHDTDGYFGLAKPLSQVTVDLINGVDFEDSDDDIGDKDMI